MMCICVYISLWRPKVQEKEFLFETPGGKHTSGRVLSLLSSNRFAPPTEHSHSHNPPDSAPSETPAEWKRPRPGLENPPVLTLESSDLTEPLYALYSAQFSAASSPNRGSHSTGFFLPQ